MEDFNKQLLCERRRLNMSMPQAARAIGVRYDLFYSWERRGCQPSAPHLVLDRLRSLAPLPYGIGHFREPDNGDKP